MVRGMDARKKRRNVMKLIILDSNALYGEPYQSSTSHAKASSRVLNAENSRPEKLFMFL